jgi:phospho-N-acetylmuramoyl-pentapeptide-transferase
MPPIIYDTTPFFIVKILVLFIASFVIAAIAAPFLIRLLYKKEAWKKQPRTQTVGGDTTPIFTKLHAEKEVNTPRMGGLLIWGTVLVMTLAMFLTSYFFPNSFLAHLNFVSRSQTWLPLFTLFAASLLGLADDLSVISNKGKYVGGGIRFTVRLGLVLLIALLGAWWFYAKLEWSSIFIPFHGDVYIGASYIILFILVTIGTFSSSVVDGLDGLAAGVMIPIFSAFSVIAYFEGLYDLTAFIAVILGALATYLWFNVHPAKFYMGETGIMGLTVTLAVIAFLTNSVLFLPIIGLILVIESGSVILQLLSKRIFHRKIFLSTPIHHHLQALGWPESQVTMRFWIISAVASALGLVVFFLSRAL